MKIGPIRHIGLITALLLALCARAAQLDVLYDFMELAASATISHAEFTEFQRYTRADGVMRPAIFLHPLLNQPISASWRVYIPPIASTDRILFVCYAGLSDGLEHHRVDGVGLSLDINGSRAFRKRLYHSSWVPAAADLTSLAGQQVELSLVSDDGGDNNVVADWALFGQPRVVRLSGNAYNNGLADVLAGGIVLDLISSAPGATLELTPVDAARAPAAPPLVIPITTTAGVWYTDFDVSRASNAVAVRVSVQNAQTRAITVAPFIPNIELIAFGTDRSVLFAGEPYALCATLKNTGKGVLTSAHGLLLTCDAAPGVTQAVARINPGEQAIVSWPMPALDKKCRLQSTLTVVCAPSAAARPLLTTNCVYYAWPAPPVLPPVPVTAPRARALENGWHVLETPQLRVLSCANGAGPLIFYVLTNTTAPAAASAAFSLRAAALTPPPLPLYARVATAPSPAELVLDTHPLPLPPARVTARKDGSLHFTYLLAKDTAKLRVTLAPHRAPGVLACSVRLDVRQPLAVRALRGPAVLVGDGTTGARKRAALFPGLEFLDQDEPSSSTRAFSPELALRLVPDPYHVSIPFMAVEAPAALVALLWDQRQQWFPEHRMLSAMFASPNFLDVRANHRLQLFVPSDTNFVSRNAIAATIPFTLQAGQSLGFSHFILLKHNTDMLDAIDAWIVLVPGEFPPPEQRPRTPRQQIELSRYAFMHTLRDAASQQVYPMLPGQPGPAPDVGFLLTIDALLTGDTSARARAQLLVERARTARDAPQLFAHGGGHVTRLGIPFYVGYLDHAWPAYRDLATRIMDTMAPDGSWAFYPAPHTKLLGEPGTKAMGVAGWWCVVLWHWARMTGDPRAISTGRRALAHLDSFRVPAGASGWEVPIAAPDILAAIYAVRAFSYAYEVTGEQHFLDRAVYWARAALPFVYLWNDPSKPGMRYAALACFGTTYFTHSWLGVPVQWEGLVLADALLELARHDASRPWRRIAEGLLVSALYQQVDDADGTPELKGTYPDSWGERFSKKIPTFLSPEGIMGVFYRLHNVPLHPHTVVASVNGAPVHITAGGSISNVVVNQHTVSFDVTWLRGGSTYAVVPMIGQPEAVVLNGAPVPMAASLDDPRALAAYDRASAALFLRLHHRGRPVPVTLHVVRPLPAEPAADNP